MPSYYVPELKSSTTQISLTGDEFHHLTRVTRHKTGDEVQVNSGSGILARAVITNITKHAVEFCIRETMSYQEPVPKFAIAFSLLKAKHDELVVEKCTELGVSTMFPLQTEFSVRHSSNNTLERFRRIALSAIKQCDNPWLPQISVVHSLQKAISQIIAAGYTPIMCSERKPDQWLHHVLHDTDKNPCFLVGPEGGWSESEYELCQEQNIPEISISNQILRAETAAITIAAQWNMHRTRLSV